MPRDALRVAVVGAGIGGLFAANALRQRGVEVAVYEQAERLGDVGAGIFITPNGLRALRAIGLGDDVHAAGAGIEGGSRYYRHDGTLVASIATADSSGWNGVCGMHRADLVGLLGSRLPDDVLHLAHRCTGFRQDDNAAFLQFENGVEAEADIVIAADGIHSRLQEHVAEPSTPVHSGSVAYRGLIPSDNTPDWPRDAWQLWMGEGKHFLVYPARRGDLINYVAFVPTTEETVESWSATGDRDEMAQHFVGWDARVMTLLECVESCFWWGLYDREPLSRWVAGRLVLLGDAAHPMLPHLGQGANQSMEDGIVLAALLSGEDRQSAPQALPRFEQFRRERTRSVQQMARQSGRRFDSADKDLRQRDQAVANSGDFRKWIYDYDVVQEIQEHLATD